MNREILFRAKPVGTFTEQKDYWVYGYIYFDHEYQKFYLKPSINIDSDKKNSMPMDYEIDPETICQYTRLKDCTGKRIYENDIVKIGNRIGTSVVKYEEGGFKPFCKHGYDSEPSADHSIVVDNIFN